MDGGGCKIGLEKKVGLALQEIGNRGEYPLVWRLLRARALALHSLITVRLKQGAVPPLRAEETELERVNDLQKESRKKVMDPGFKARSAFTARI